MNVLHIAQNPLFFRERDVNISKMSINDAKVC